LYTKILYFFNKCDIISAVNKSIMQKGIKLILPNNGVSLDRLQSGERVYFLAGPIRGGDDWQANAIQMLYEKDPFCYIACPCRYGPEHPLFQYSLPATESPSSMPEQVEYEYTFDSQTYWERFYLEEASQRGSVIFWLPCESKENPRKKEDGPYARDTYGELGRWSLRSANPDEFSVEKNNKRVNVVVGAEEEFPGLSIIQKNFDGDHEKRFIIYQTLEQTIIEAVKLGKQYNPMPMMFND
jgi:hypothetical protein